MKYQIRHSYLTLFIDSPISIIDLFQQFHLSKKTIHLMKQNKSYLVNNRYVSPSTVLVKGDQLTFKAFQEDDGMYPPVYEDLNIVYEDEFLLIVNKPPFLQVFPAKPDDTNSLAHRVSGYYHQQGYNLPVRFIHRLDYETSGLMIFVKCAFVQPLLDYQLSMKDIHRHYLAIVEGTFHNHQWHTIDKPIGKDRHHQQRMIVHPHGKKACTHYRCLSSKNHLSLIECVLDSGRKHQIRVHMSAIGHPILSDHLYGHSSALLNHQALHAYQIECIHPITKEKLTLTCQPPSDMLKLIKKMGPQF